MNIDYDEKDKLLTFKITEEIDHHWSEKIRRKVDNEIERYVPKKVIFDFDKVAFMDSAGIGMLLRKIQSDKNARWKLRNDKCKIKYKKNFRNEWDT